MSAAPRPIIAPDVYTARLGALALAGVTLPPAYLAVLAQVQPGDVLLVGAGDDWVSQLIARRCGDALATHAILCGYAVSTRGIDADGTPTYTHSIGGVESDLPMRHGLPVPWAPAVHEVELVARLTQYAREHRPVTLRRHASRVAAACMGPAAYAGARIYLGRRYDLGQLLLYGVLGTFIADGEGRLICSRLCTAAWDKTGHPILPRDPHALLDRFPKPQSIAAYEALMARVERLAKGYVTPSELRQYADLVTIAATHT